MFVVVVVLMMDALRSKNNICDGEGGGDGGDDCYDGSDGVSGYLYFRTWCRKTTMTAARQPGSQNNSRDRIFTLNLILKYTADLSRGKDLFPQRILNIFLIIFPHMDFVFLRMDLFTPKYRTSTRTLKFLV